MSYVECHERDPKTSHQMLVKTYCGFTIAGSPIHLGEGEEVTCPQCIEKRKVTDHNEEKPE